jgi:hypothetical protein
MKIIIFPHLNYTFLISRREKNDENLFESPTFLIEARLGHLCTEREKLSKMPFYLGN